MTQDLAAVDNIFSAEMMDHLLHATNGFNGREMSKLFIAIHQALLIASSLSAASANISQVLTPELVLRVMRQKDEDHNLMTSFSTVK